MTLHFFSKIILPKIKLNLKNFLFFISGCFLGLVLIILGFSFIFEYKYKDRIYPGVKIGKIDVGEHTTAEVKEYFEKQSNKFENLEFTFKYATDSAETVATFSGKTLEVGLDAKLLSDQAFLIGRSGGLFTMALQKIQAQRNHINLPLSYKYKNLELEQILNNLAVKIDIPAQEALFKFDNGRVAAFQPSANGRKLEKEKAISDFQKLLFPPASGEILLSTITVYPKVKTGEANNLGIKELIASGKSYFRGSIANRVFNINLAASKINGILIAPNETFSFNHIVGDISSQTGYKQAYVIKEKKTVLDDGGGVCQVSTTLFRAALNSGLPIIERQAHAYRVGYYEQGGFDVGLDATVYNPTVDLKFKNDTANYILIQITIDNIDSSLTIDFYGTKDNRQVQISQTKILDQSPPPPDLYQDDPNLPKGEIKQIDFQAFGAKTSFNYKVTRGNEVLQNQTFFSNYQPWQAVFLRGTKE